MLALVMLVYTKYYTNKEKVVDTTSDTTSTTRIKIITAKNSFTAEQVGNIKRMLIDSLKAALIPLYSSKENGKEIHVEAKLNSLKDSSSSGYVYTSIIDSNFVSKDSTGFIIDSTYVKSTFISPTQLSKNSIHLLSVDQKSFCRQKETVTTITNTKIVEKQKSFFERFKIVPNISAGVGIITKTFDFYAGVGICFEF